MKIVRYFLHEEDEMTGTHGFIPLWIPKSAGFNVSGARGMIHDALEHALSDTGKPWQEVVAFGRILALRLPLARPEHCGLRSSRIIRAQRAFRARL